MHTNTLYKLEIIVSCVSTEFAKWRLYGNNVVGTPSVLVFWLDPIGASENVKTVLKELQPKDNVQVTYYNRKQRSYTHKYIASLTRTRQAVSLVPLVSNSVPVRQRTNHNQHSVSTSTPQRILASEQHDDLEKLVSKLSLEDKKNV